MIRPIDLQNSVLSAQGAPAVQRAEVGSRMDAQAAQAAFAAEIARRDESVAEAGEVLGNRIGAKPDEGKQRESARDKHKARTPFEQVVDEAAGSAEEPAHIVDFQA